MYVIKCNKEFKACFFSCLRGLFMPFDIVAKSSYKSFRHQLFIWYGMLNVSTFYNYALVFQTYWWLMFLVSSFIHVSATLNIFSLSKVWTFKLKWILNLFKIWYDIVICIFPWILNQKVQKFSKSWFNGTYPQNLNLFDRKLERDPLDIQDPLCLLFVWWCLC